MSSNDLQALFANLKPKPRDSPAPPSQPIRSTSYASQSYSQTPAGLPSSPPPLTSPINAAVINSQPSMAHPGASTNAQSLLSLLNFGSSATPAQPTSSASTTAPQPSQPNIQEQGNDNSWQAAGRTPSVTASDLLSKFMSPSPAATSTLTRPQPHAPSQLEDQGGGGLASGSHYGRDPSQDALLKLLNRATSNHSSAGASARQGSVERTRSAASQVKAESATPGSADLALRFLESQQEPIPTSEEPKPENTTSVPKKPLFTYTNPFEALQASRSQTPNVKAPASTPLPLDPDVPQPSVESSAEQPWAGSPVMATPEHIAMRKILTPRLSSINRQTTLSREPSVSAPGPEENSEKPVKESAKDSGFNKTDVQPIVEDAANNSSSASNDQNPSDQGPEQLNDPTSGAGDEWEDADDGDDSPEAESRVVPVYNFPIKPFVSITLNLEPSTISIRDDGVMEISRLKKEFDQLDRSLAAATTKYITYALVKNGGMRIIRQDDGSDRQVFKNSHDRIFNVALCSTAPLETPTDPHATDHGILGTGVSGAVYYATINKDGNDLFEKNNLDSQSLIFPPYPPADENTAGGVLKTRAKRSSRHPEFFAIGRGKAIHLIWPATAMSPRYGITQDNRRVDVDTFFQERSLQISTGKAGKDFSFSEDDSLIVSLDKTGRLRFWDIRKLIEEADAGGRAALTVDMPLLSLSTASPSEKSWPTSVHFVDKVRPYIRGGPLRYVLVGLRQNHTLQLWDIALGKAVQEINFPHENETDGICSVNYHANSGIIVVGHPTRNSIFFIHLSAPRYTLSGALTQAAFVNRIAMKDPELPQPESTACMSGIRELSFAGRGQLRSVELLPVHRSTEAQKAVDVDAPLFELYVVHSKGVTCINIIKEDLGLSADSKVIHGIDANKEGLISLKELRLGSVIEEPPRPKSPVSDAQLQAPAKSTKKKSKKAAVAATVEAPFTEEETTKDAPSQSATNGAPPAPISAPEPVNGDVPPVKESKKSKKKAAAAAAAALASEKPTSRNASPSKNAQPPSAFDAATAKDASTSANGEHAIAPPVSAPSAATESALKSEAVSVGISGDWLDKELKKIERGVSAEFRKELGTLYTNIQNDRLVQDSSSAARQEAILRLVSSTLTTNVEKSLSRILASQMQQVVVPAITGLTVQAVTTSVGDAVTKSMHSALPRELSSQLQAAVSSALQSPQVTRNLIDTVSQKVSKQTEHQLVGLVQKEIMPSFRTLAVEAAEKAALDVEARLRNEIQRFEHEKQQDTVRLEKLSQVMQSMAQTLQQLSDTQLAFQNQILKDRRQIALLGDDMVASGSRQVSTARASASPLQGVGQPPQKPKSREEIEIEEISQLLDDGRYEEASVRWLQSSQQSELFDRLFIRFTPEYLETDVSPLIAFSIAVTIGNSLNTNIAQRLEWILAAFNAVDLTDSEMIDLAQHAPQLLSSLIQKIEGLYMTMAERDPRDPALRIMPAVSKKAKDMRAALLGSSTPSYARAFASPRY
ncbi:hypothetical protein PV10_04140 [Exophiala mesophila]|uniref:EDC4-like protein pdc1 beta-propeller domain-containing protein n=1 Tax=Exophiala mesophila TaxID=212818 RepID=A0A0D1XXB6_EXOME|nr:uncharacterized protein PV10_04140 [Exophiala mesophila]KIV92876.1 hypothetical protein PV10_04140 [Exophiala mesophila]